MTKKKKQWGGKREGAGRPSSGIEKIQLKVYISEKAMKVLKMKKGELSQSEFIEKLIFKN